MKIKQVENKHNLPMDFGFEFGQSLKEWLLDNGCPSFFMDIYESEFSLISAKIDLYKKVYSKYRIISDGKLRHPPVIVTNINPLEAIREASDGLEYWFVFKEENNGNTYLFKTVNENKKSWNFQWEVNL
jgi:hypothetical protein